MLEAAPFAGEQQAPQEQQCPKCKAKIPVNPGFINWCDKCSWNLRPAVLKKPKTVFDKLYVRLGEKSSKQLFDKLIKQTSLRPQLTPTKVASFVMAALTHSVTLILVALSLLLIIKGWPGIVPVCAGLFCGFVAWAVRPILPKQDKDDEPIDPEKFPTLFRVIGEVARALGTTPPETVIIDADYNAAFGQLGWGRKRTLFLGMPLLAIGNSQDLVALLGHELAHGVNGDPNRSLFVRNAVRSLLTWYDVLAPRRTFTIRRYGQGLYDMFILEVFANGMMWLISRPIYCAVFLMAHLVWYDMQRAEYLADHLGARVSGTAAALSSLDKLHLYDTFALAVQQVSLANDKRNVFDLARQRVERLPAREVERIRRVEKMNSSRLDSSHPPTHLRIQFLQERSAMEPQVTIAEADFAQIKRELAILEPHLQAELIDRHRARISY